MQGKPASGQALMQDSGQQHRPESDETDAERAEHDPLPNNVKAMLALRSRRTDERHPLHKFLESIGYSVEKPYFVVVIVAFAGTWMLLNTLGKRFGFAPFDGPPFPWLQGIVSFGSLVTATIVVAKQNRAAADEKRQSHLQLQLIMLTEQKVAKLIQLVEELRRDLPMIESRHDPEAETLKNSPHAQTVLDIIEEHLDGER